MILTPYPIVLRNCLKNFLEYFFQFKIAHNSKVIICEQIVELKIAELYHGLSKQHLVLQVKQIQIA